MADDSEQDLIPVKEPKSLSVPPIPRSTGSDILLFDRSTAVEKRIAEQLSRNELEDQLYRLKDENLELKKTSHKQEDQLKKLSTKMSRLMSERRKLEINSSPARKRDLELEEVVEQLQDRVRNLEKSNITLREKLLVAKQQVITNVRRPNPYHHIPPKVQTGRPRSGISPYAFSASLQNIQRKTAATPLPPYVIQLLDEARNELFALKDQATSQRNEIEVLEQENEILKERMRIKDTKFEEEVNMLKSQITEGQRQHVQENLDLIRLHRELKQKNSNIVELQARYMDAEEKVRLQKGTQDRLVKELEDKSIHLREEQKKSFELFAELQKNKAVLVNLTELQENLKILKKENDVLKDTNDQLIKSVIKQQKDQVSSAFETTLKEQIAKLEMSLNAEQKGKNDLIDEIRTEKEKYQKLHEIYLELQTEFTSIKSEKDELESKVNILKSEDIDFEELGAALAVMKMKKLSPDDVDSQKEEEEELKLKLQRLESDYAEAVKELCDVREMLMTQYKLNQDAQEEVKAVTEREIQAKKEFQTKLEEYATLLDLRAAEIQKLKKQLNDIAYGAKKFKIENIHQEMETIETLQLNHGENIFEIHITKFIYSTDGLQVLEKNDPYSFITWNFYEFELQSSPVMKGSNPHFAFSANYAVRVDDFFLFYLHKNTTTLELHESLGTDYKTLAACQLNFSELLEMSSGRVHGTEQLISISENSKGIVFGTVHYWVKLHVPMDEAFKLYKEKFKALKYIHSNKTAAENAVKVLNKPSESDDTVNHLHIKILRCTNLKGRHKDVQPSPFCVYKFFDLADQDTIIIPASSNPEFSDHRTFPIFMDSDIEKYLKTENLEVYVFDDNDPDISSYIGKASIPLLPLAQDKSLKEMFQLMKDNEINGTIEVSLYWQHSYQLATSLTDLPKEIIEPMEYPSHIPPVLSISSDDDETKTTLDVSRPVPKPRQRILPKPLLTSTPTKSLTDSSSDSSSPEKRLKPNLSASSHETKSPKPPQPAIRRSRVQLSTVDDFIAYGETFLRSPEKRSETIASSSPVKSPKKVTPNSPEKDSGKDEELIDDEDTMLEKKHEISFEEISDEDKQALTDSGEDSEKEDKLEMTSTSENQKSPKSPSVNHPAQLHMLIKITSLALKPQASIVTDSSVKMLYVEFSFLDFPIEELETPVAMPKPVPPDLIVFDFEKEFDFSEHENQLKLNQLAQMFDPLVPGASRLKFTVVSEPPTDDEDLDCEEVGFAYVDLKEIMDTGKDIIDKNISIHDAKDNETEIGSLCVSIHALDVLQLLHETFS